MKILLIPNFSNYYDQRMIRDLSNALKLEGEDSYYLLQPISEKYLSKFCYSYNFDVVLQINKLRPIHHPLPRNTRHISWFHDVFPSLSFNYNDLNIKDDICYALSSPENLSIPIYKNCKYEILSTGVNYQELSLPLDYECDFSFCGFIPNVHRVDSIITLISFYLAETVRRIPYIRDFLFIRMINNYLSEYPPKKIINDLKSLIELNYNPLTGSLDIRHLEKLIYDFLNLPSYYHKRLNNTFYNDNENIFPIESKRFSNWCITLIDWLTREYPRYLDRFELIERIKTITDSIHLYGIGWNKYNEFYDYHRGILKNTKALFNVYKSSKINLANNNHGIGMHSRNLECIMSGGFLMYHESENDKKKGGFSTEFEPNVDYGIYNNENLTEIGKYWLENKELRKKCIINSRKKICSNHLWKHGALQILNDLKT